MEKIITVRGDVDWGLIINLLNLEIEQTINDENKEIIDEYKAAKAALMARVEIKETDITDSIDELVDVLKEVEDSTDEWRIQRKFNLEEDIDTLKKIIGGK